MSLYRIDINTATQLLLNFLTQKPLFDYATKKSIGGIISKDSLRGKGLLFYGTMAWFCWRAPTPFLAFEDGEYDHENPPTEPKSGKLLCCRNLYTYSGGAFFEDVKEFISKPVDPNLILPDAEIEKELVLPQIGGLPGDASSIPFNKYPFGFFENRIDHDVRDFLAQDDLTYVRYFYGFDDVTDYHSKTNRIRIVLMGLDSNGQCFVPGIKANSFMLQKSWPPPPNTKDDK